MTTPPHSGRMAASGAPGWTTQAELLNEMSRMAKVGGWEFDPSTGQGSWTDEVARIHEDDFAALGALGRLRSRAHRRMTAYPVRATACTGCGACVTACPETAVVLVPRQG